MDTANALLLRDACDLDPEKIEALLEVLKRRAFEFKSTPQVGRTHGIHAEPTSFGLTFALWYDEMRRNQRSSCAKPARRLQLARSAARLAPLRISIRRLKKRSARASALKAAPVSTQIIQRDNYAEYLCTLAIIASSLDKFALQIRHWQRTEVREAQEKFKRGQKGSSAMPHKRNPILSERICGMARVVRANSIVGLENVALWHERDISHSSAERVVLPDSSIAIDYMLQKMASLIDGLVVYPERMLENLNATRGSIFSGQLLLALDAGRRFARAGLRMDAAQCAEGLGRRNRTATPGPGRQRNTRASVRGSDSARVFSGYLSAQC